MTIKNRIGRTIEITPEFVRMETMYSMREQIIPRQSITTFQLNRSVYDLPFLEKTVTLFTVDGKKHAMKHLKTKDAEQIIKELQQSHAIA
jgi:predicted mannosyl-3-phosphoglycerate phosphatase (HAD superfamily)